MSYQFLASLSQEWNPINPSCESRKADAPILIESKDGQRREERSGEE